MSNIDKRALREAAGKAGADEWCAFIDTKSKTYSVHTPGDNRCGDVVKWAGFDGQQRAAAKAKFIAAANPATVLELLDELEAAEKQLASWRSLAKQNIEEHEKAVAALDTARHRICELESKLTQNESWSLAAQKYIAALEAREVKLPELKMLRDYLAEVTMREREDILVGVRLEFFRAFEEAGVKVSAAAGKGEAS
ncbi:TPA: ead/Ea22-like family protein [Enterobacter roggenkampii]